MVYAVAMRTIKNFERALGRVMHWPPCGDAKTTYRQQLTLYPHYMENANAYYEADGGIHFGYFESGPEAVFPGTVVFSCLSQDVIAHQVTHALLMGLNVEFDIGTNPDVAALHEGFADLIALFQHFSESAVLRQQIGAIRGNLEERSQLGAVAPQFGGAIGQPDGLRNALGFTDAEGNWQPRRPDPKLYETEDEPHARGDLLVGAVFEAFKKIYESRVDDLRRIATQGTGVLPKGYLHPDLVNRLTQEAAKSARHVLDMCMRALDYLPPVEVTFGDFLRAIVTADADLVPNDHRRYRVAFVDAFRSYGIGPAGLGTLSVDTLRWSAAGHSEASAAVSEFVKMLSQAQSYWNIPREREARWHTLEAWRHALEEQLKQQGKKSEKLGVIDLTEPFEVVSFDLRERAALTGDFCLQWVIKIIQRDDARAAGCTMLVDAETGVIRYQIEKATGGRKRKADLLKRSSGAGGIPHPMQRRLRVFAFDPSVGIQLDSAGLNEVTLAIPVGARRQREGHPHPRPGRRVRRGGRPRSRQRRLLRAGRPERLGDRGAGRPAAVGEQPAVPPADGLRRDDADDPELRAGARQARALVAASRRGRREVHARSTCRGCASIRTRCARRTRTTARRRRRCSSATSPRRWARKEPARRRSPSSPASPTTSSRTR